MKQKYLNERKALLDKAQACINDGDIDGFNALHAEIEKLDNDYSAKAAAQANLDALNKSGSVAPLSNFAGNTALHFNDGIESTVEDFYDTAKYRKSFMNYVLTGKKSADMFNQDENTKTTDVGSVIPTTILNRIIEKMEAESVILPLVTKTNYKGGLSVPTSTVKPVASWVNEGAGSDRQKKTTSYISFAYHKLRCEISVSLEVDTMALSAFETAFVNQVSEAMIKKLEEAIIKGTGSGQPKGILAETPASGQAISIAANAGLSYKLLCELEAALPAQYETGTKWFMSKKTFMEFYGLVDTNKQPIARVNYGIGGKPERFLLGREVLISENVANYAAAPSANTIVAFMFRPSDYILNTNLNMGVKQFEDNDTDDVVRKAIMLVDGKVVDKNSLVTLTVNAPVGGGS